MSGVLQKTAFTPKMALRLENQPFGVKSPTCSFNPFGNALAMSGTLVNPNRYRFSSKEIHPNSGLYYYGYRYYEPNLQRWLNADPIEEAGGFNLYSCVGNRPFTAIDPWGWSDFNAPPGSVSGSVSPGSVPLPSPLLPTPGQVPPGCSSSWPTGIDSRGAYLLDPLTGRKYWPDPNTPGHWPHYDWKDPNGKEGRYPKKCFKPKPNQKKEPYGDQSATDPWAPPPTNI